MKTAMWLLASVFLAVQATQQLAAPLDPVVAIVDAFRSHGVVALSETGHGEEWGYTFLLSLLRDSRFVAVVNDLVIENGSARYQDVADRFVRGENVSDESLSQAWRDTVTPGLGDDQWWLQVFREVRAANASRARERQIRVLLGDPPIDWEHVHTREEHRTWVEMRDTFPADLIQREVLAKGRRALLRYGQMHYQRKQMVANYESEGDAQTIVSRLENLHHASVFTIWTSRVVPMLQPNAASWPAPSVALVRGTVLGAADFTAYYPSEALGRFALRDGKADFSKPIPRTEWRTLHAEDQFDAVLYPGPEPPVIVQRSREECANKARLDETLRRMSVSGPPQIAAQLKQFCGVANPN